MAKYGEERKLIEDLRFEVESCHVTRFASEGAEAA
jgi:hypothetical protein